MRVGVYAGKIFFIAFVMCIKNKFICYTTHIWKHMYEKTIFDYVRSILRLFAKYIKMSISLLSLNKRNSVLPAKKLLLI